MTRTLHVAPLASCAVCFEAHDVVGLRRVADEAAGRRDQDLLSDQRVDDRDDDRQCWMRERPVRDGWRREGSGTSECRGPPGHCRRGSRKQRAGAKHPTVGANVITLGGKGSGPLGRGSGYGFATCQRWRATSSSIRPQCECSCSTITKSFARGVRDLLEAAGGLEVVGEASTAAEALQRVPAVRPDVAVLDVRLPDGNGVEVCRDLRTTRPDLRCMMLTSYDDDEALLDAIIAGASGYVLKEVRAADIVSSVRRIAAGESLLDPHATARVIERLRNPPPEDQLLASLSPQGATDTACWPKA